MVDTVTTTVLFTDLVGSTALTTSVAPAEGEALRKAHFAALREVIDGAGGTEVKNLGDGLMAVFPSASRAVSCAVAMQQAVDLHNRASAVALAIRVGVASGEVTADDGDYFGDPVVEASRLCAVAESGQILATQLVRLNAGRHTTAEFSDIGPLTLKGLPEPVAAVAVGWSPAPDDEASDNHRVPLPRRLRVTGPVRFVGRSPERATLAAAWKAASAGATRVVFVAGEAGIGKSRLVAEVAAEAHGNGGIVIYGGCDDGVAVAYRPWREALGHLVTHVDRAVLDAVGDRRLADLGRVLPEVRERIPGLVAPVDSDAETERYLFWSAVAALVAEAGRSTPVLVVLDDLHWADQPSALLFRHVVTVGDCGGVLIVGTYRDGEIGGGHPMADLLAALHRAPGVERIILAGLGDDELVEFVDAAAGAPLGDAGTEFSRALYRETSGNPFFAWEVLRHLAETGVAVHDTGGWATRVEMGDLRLPDSVREVVGQRVARLSPDVQRILSLASVIGDTFDIDLLASVASRSDDVVLDHLETAASAGLVRNVTLDQFTFTHALIRHTVYGDLTPARRARTHRQIAEILESSGGDAGRAGELARHWAAAVTPTDIDRAVAATTRAGDQALVALAPHEAVRWYRQALDLLDHHPGSENLQRCELLCRLADAGCQAGDPGHRAVALSAAALAQQLGDADRLVRSALTGYWPAAGEEDPERVAILDAALSVLGPEDTRERAAILSRLKPWLIFSDPARAEAVGAEAIAVARRVGDPRLFVEAATRPGWGFYTRAHVEAFMDQIREAQRVVASLDDPAASFNAEFHRHWLAIVVADRPVCEDSVDRLLTLAQQVGRPDLRWQAAYTHADWVLLQGDLAEADRLIQSVWELGSATSQPGAIAIHAAQMQALRWHQGRGREAAGLIAEAAAKNPAMSVLHLPTEPTADLAAVVEAVPRDAAWLQAMTLLADLAVRQQDAEVCSRITELVRPYADIFAGEGPLRRGPVAHYLGTLTAATGHARESVGYFEQATDMSSRLTAPFFIARTQIEHARVLQGLDEGQQANRLLNSAIDIARQHGYEQQERRALRLVKG